MSQSPALEEVINEAINATLDTVWTAMPGRVMSYDSGKRRANVKPDIKQEIITPDGEAAYVPMPVIHQVPVIHFGNGSLGITAPVEAGDTVLMVFMSCELDDWKSNPRASSQGKGGSVQPKTPRRFSLGDAVAIPGLLQFASLSTGDKHADDRIQMGSPAGPKVEVDHGHVYLGGSESLISPKPDKLAVNESALDHFVSSLLSAIVSSAISNPPGAAFGVALFKELTGITISPLSPPTSLSARLWSPGVTNTYVK